MSKEKISRRAARKQAAFVVSRGLALGKSRHDSRNDGLIHSLGTARTYQQGLTLLCEWIQSNRLGDLRGATIKTILRYLEERASRVGQKTLDRDRQAAQFLLRQTCGAAIALPRTSSTFQGGRGLAKQPRAYTPEQAELIANNQSGRTAISTRIAYAAGLRAHELYTLSRRDERSASRHRLWSPDRFCGRDGVLYTVAGKGGLVREVMLPRNLSEELEKRRLRQPGEIIDRGIRYAQRYDISGGRYFSGIFGATSKRMLGWSTGAHGLRHSYAQDRMIELLELGYSREARTTIVSQELGHFRPGIVNEYLR